MITNDSVWSWGTRSEEGHPSVFSAPPSPDLLPNPYHHAYPFIGFHPLNQDNSNNNYNNNNNNAMMMIMKEGENNHNHRHSDVVDNDNISKKKNVSRNLYVASLPNDFTKEELFELFEEYGEIISCEMRPYQPQKQQSAHKGKTNNNNNNNNEKEENNKTGYGKDHSAYGFVCFRRLPDAIRAQRARVGYILPRNKNKKDTAPRLQVRFTPAPAFLQRRAPSGKSSSVSPPSLPSSSSSSVTALPVCPTSPVMLWYWYPMAPSSFA